MDENLTKLLRDFWQWFVKESPEFATSIGNHELDDVLEDMSLKAYEKRVKDAEDFLTKLEQIDVNKLSKDNKLNYKLLHLELTNFIDGMAYFCYLFPVNCLDGPQSDFRRTVTWMKKEVIGDFEKILSRFNKFPQQAGQVIELMKKGVETGYVNAKISVEPVLSQLRSIVETPAKESPFFEPFLEIPSSIDEEQRNSLQERALTAIKETLYPAYTNIHDYIEKNYLPACRDNIACTSLPSGKQFYDAVLKFHISTDMTPDEVHQTGLDEVARIRSRMKQVMKEVGFEGTLEDFFTFLRNDPKFYFDKKEDFLSFYEKKCAEIDKLLPAYFKSLPKMKYVIKETPAEGAASLPGAYYYAGTLDGRPGIFYLNTHSFEERPSFNCAALCLHEAVPGHHLQGSLSIEQENLPDFRRYCADRCYYLAPGRFSLHTAYLEGWGLYSEYLGEEMKVYKTPYDLFGRLSFEIFRACRCVVDTGMHAKGWDRQQAIDYMTANSAIPLVEVHTEIDRYITWPGQACGYKIGEIKIRELRKKAETKLGANFDLKEFHDVVLLQAALPLSMLEDIVDEYIANHS